MSKIPFIATAVALVAACASQPPVPPAPPPLEPVGTYTFDSYFEGQPISGKIYITGSEGAYGGEVVPDQGPPPVPILSVTVTGQELTLLADAGGEDLVVTVIFDGDTFTGVWSLAGDSGELSGARIESP